jgi:dTDP-4-dehydrorhamnose 3,5-epimerase
MIFTETKLPGAYIIEPEKIEDERGFFARTWCRKEFTEHGLNTSLVQCNVSFNMRKGTLRGMHYQAEPYEEAKLVRCTAGAVYDVIIDLRPASATYCQWLGVELASHSSEIGSRLNAGHKMLYIPEGFAHGFLTLEDETEVFYQMSEAYVPDCARGVRWDDPAFGIRWPLEVSLISEKDRLYRDFVR